MGYTDKRFQLPDKRPLHRLNPDEVGWMRPLGSLIRLPTEAIGGP